MVATLAHHRRRCSVQGLLHPAGIGAAKFQHEPTSGHAMFGPNMSLKERYREAHAMGMSVSRLQ